MAALSDVIAQVESANRCHELRFEPGLYTRWLDPLPPSRDAILSTITRANGPTCTRDTARVIACMSWGVFQILGENIYSICRVIMPVVEFATDHNAQLAAFNNFCAHHSIDPAKVLGSAAETERFAVVWNGPGNVNDYLRRIANAIRAFNGR